MDWITFIWGFIAAIHLFLGWIHLLIRINSPGQRWQLLFIACSLSAVAVAFQELYIIKYVKTPADYEHTIRFAMIPFSGLIVSTVWFIHHYTNAGRRWLALLFTAMRVMIIALNFISPPSFNFRSIEAIVQFPLLDGSFPIPVGTRSPWGALGNISQFIFLIYCLDCAIRVWRMGGRQRAVLICGSSSLFAAFCCFQTIFGPYGWYGVIFDSLTVSLPVFSHFYLGVAIAMSVEISREVIRATRLSKDLRENERRLALAVEAASLDIWMYDLRQSQLWLGSRACRLLGLEENHPITLARFLTLLNEEDRAQLEAAFRSAVESRGTFEAEYRLLLRGNHPVWIVSRGEVEIGPGGEPVLLRGASLDITSRRLAEEAAMQMSGLLICAQEEERARLARELHDDLSQRLALHSIELDLLRETPPTDSAGFKQQIHQLSENAAALSTEIHKLSHDLHPAELRRLGLVSSIRAFCRDFARVHGIDTRLTDQMSIPEPGDDLALCLYRIVQEALRNVARHSGASTVILDLKAAGDIIELRITDNGRGFDPHLIARKQSLGIISMKERSRLLGGHLVIDSAPDRGTSVSVCVPLSLTS